MSKLAGAVDLRKTVKQISPHTLFSSKWFAMLGSLQHVTDTALVEQKAKEGSGGEVLKTLWERNELTIRYLLEEGKLNLCLRLMIDFKSMQRKEMFADALAAAKAAEPQHAFDDLPTIKVKAALYEQCLGVLLSCAFHSVESLQTLDMPSLFEHMGQTLEFSLSHSEMPRSPDADRRQEILSLHYLAAMFDKIERLQEDRIMDLIMEHKVTELVIKNVTLYHTFYSPNTKKQAALAMSGIMSTEAFKSSPHTFVPSLEVKKELVELDANFLKDEFPDYAAKKQIRPLLDTIGKFKYKL
mmetsp:Transcript_8399/g.20908  ORF Transcript_8399/g.20908 Transcript_8399/m.20908 type:complete len:298 (+) Transcript_8399:194-1087(+)|eukprot:CAMPEP_0206218116 /NCGR_PEP_ID=MMETSP0047_2-20121206/3630_1 /ASSEMBLY_ACC=CAM_ASM_000192 /TAXON_ID=195065 /ORGANISM="Chroomonas mesostigmatica_cf, Strain CCMP1168" /LENGTH=297 /DNA_ID=CAMNT_0053640603 /DNA_START=112 /DNA_END=1005 /DNA_ORIENTATION=-